MAQNNCLPGCLRFGPMPVMRSSVIRIVRSRKRRGARGISDRDMGHRQDYFEDFFHSQEVVDFAIARARAGANF